MTHLPGDIVRVLSWEELPPSVREIPAGYDPMAEGVLMSHQADWIRQIHGYDLNIAEKGRRTGITFATALDDTITASSTRKAGGDNAYYIGDTKEKGLEYIGYCAHMAKVMASAMAEGWEGIEVFLFEDQLEDGSSKNITAYRIRFASGFQIVALSSNPANIRGLQGIVNIDEAAFHQQVRAVIEACLALIIWGGKIRIISTHNTVKSPFNELVRDSRAGLYAFKVFRVTFDDAVANGLFERVCLVKGWTPSPENKKAWYEKVRGAYGANKAAMLEELDGIPREGDGVAIPSIYIERCMREERPVLRLRLDNEFALRDEEYRRSWCSDWIRRNLEPLRELLDHNLEHHFGLDYARHFDFSVTGPLATAQNLMRICPFIIEMLNVPTRQQEQVLWYMIDMLPKFQGGAMDATGNGATLAEYTADKYGHHRIHQVKLNDAWYRDNMGSFQDAFADGMIDVPRDVDIRNDIRALELINGVIKLPAIKQQDSKDKGAKRHGDGAIMLAMAWFSSRQGRQPAWANRQPEGRQRLSVMAGAAESRPGQRTRLSARPVGGRLRDQIRAGVH